MRTSTGPLGATLSPGWTWRKSPKMAALRHTTSLITPSMTGGASNRGMCAGVFFSTYGLPGDGAATLNVLGDRVTGCVDEPGCGLGAGDSPVVGVELCARAVKQK